MEPIITDTALIAPHWIILRMSYMMWEYSVRSPEKWVVACRQKDSTIVLLHIGVILLVPQFSVGIQIYFLFFWSVQLGLGDSNNRDLPVQVTMNDGERVARIACGWWHTLAAVLVKWVQAYMLQRNCHKEDWLAHVCTCCTCFSSVFFA